MTITKIPTFLVSIFSINGWNGSRFDYSWCVFDAENDALRR